MFQNLVRPFWLFGASGKEERMDFKHVVHILFGILAAFIIGVALVAIYQTIFKTGGVVDLALNEVFTLIMNEIKATMQ